MSRVTQDPPKSDRTESESTVRLQRGAAGPYASSCFFQEGSWVVVMKPVRSIYIGKVHRTRTFGAIVGAGKLGPKAAAVSGCHMKEGQQPRNILNNRQQTYRVLEFMKDMGARVYRSMRDVDVEGRYFASHVECQLALHWVRLQLYFSFQTYDWKRIEELKAVDLPGHRREAFLYLDHKPCFSCRKFLNFIRQKSGINIIAVPRPALIRHQRKQINVSKLDEHHVQEIDGHLGQDINDQNGQGDASDEPAEELPGSPQEPTPVPIQGQGPCPVSWRRGKPYPLLPQWLDYSDTPSHIPTEAKNSMFENEYRVIESPPSLPSFSHMRRTGKKYSQKLASYSKDNGVRRKRAKQGDNKFKARRKPQAEVPRTAVAVPKANVPAVTTIKQLEGQKRRAAVPKRNLDVIYSLDSSRPKPTPALEPRRGTRVAKPAANRQPDVTALPAKIKKRERYTATARPYGGMWRNAQKRAEKQGPGKGAAKFPDLSAFAYQGNS